MDGEEEKGESMEFGRPRITAESIPSLYYLNFENDALSISNAGSFVLDDFYRYEENERGCRLLLDGNPLPYLTALNIKAEHGIRYITVELAVPDDRFETCTKRVDEAARFARPN